MISQGDIYWVDFPEPIGSEPGYRHPCVVIQNDAFNFSRLATTIVCMITTNQRLSGLPGNVVLNRGEGGLSERCVANVTQLYTVDRSMLSGPIGKLKSPRVEQIISGVLQVLIPRE